MDTFTMVVIPAACIYCGVTTGKIGIGIAMAVGFIILMQLLKLWRNFWAKHPKLAKALKVTLGSILVIILILAGVPIIPLAVGAVLLIGGINFLSESHRKDKQKTQEFLDDFHDEMQRDVENYRRKKKLDEEKRKAARAEAEHLEDLARLWERNAQKYRTPKDIRKAREYREQADAAWRKIR